MIRIIDGKPGDGKTQFTIQTLLKISKNENRPVYYYNIPELQIPEWIEIEVADQWFKLPDGAIIVIDEAQKIYPLRKAGSDKPPHVSALETHRHKGHDLYLITQDGTLLDIQCRKLCSQYFHLKRVPGTSKVTLTEYTEFTNHNDYHERKKAVSSSLWSHDKKIWKLYKSATVHTKRTPIPKKLLAVPVVFVVCGLLFYNVYARFTDEERNMTANQETPGETIFISQPEKTQAQIAIDEKLQYFEQYRPRIRDKPETAPVYDGLRTVTSYPRLQCIKSEKIGCSCYTQQATRINISEKRCNEFIVKGDTFDPAIPDNALTLANQLPEQSEPDYETVPGTNPWQDENPDNILVLSAEPWYNQKTPLKYATEDRGGLTIERVVNTN